MMAKINFYLGDIVGKLSGLVFQGGPSGPILRSKGLQVNPLTPKQTAQRELFAGFSREWAYELTQSQRDAWNALASGVTLKDAFGNDYSLNGSGLYMRINNTRLLVGDAVLTDAPVNLQVRSLQNVVYTAAPSGDPASTITFVPDCLITERIYFSQAVNQGLAVEYVGDGFLFARASIVLAVSPLDIDTGPSNIPSILGRKNFYLVQRYNSVNGMLSPGVIVSRVVDP